MVLEFPLDLWQQIFYKVSPPESKSHQDRDGITFWLSLRSVSKSWCAGIAKMDWARLLWWDMRAAAPYFVYSHHLLRLFPFSKLSFFGAALSKLPDLSWLTHLQDLHIFGVENHSIPTHPGGKPIPTTQIGHLSQLSRLTSLNAAGFEICPEALLHLTNLQSLELSRTPPVNDIHTLTNLHSLCVHRGFTANVDHLPKLVNITAYPAFFKKGRGKADVSPKGGGQWGRYDGEWLDGKRHGEGCFSEYEFGASPDFGDSSICDYVGEWKDDKKHGYGLMQWPESHVVEGQFCDGVIVEEARGYFRGSILNFYAKDKSNWRTRWKDTKL